MTVYIIDVDDIVDPLPEFDKAASTESLQYEQVHLEYEADELKVLIQQLTDYIDEVETRISEIETEVAVREGTFVTA
jgi:predicted  nucleic acid-binding Zn-ribbon protein